MLKYLKTILFSSVILGGMTGCSSADKEALFIHFSADGTAIVVDHIDPAGLHQLKTGKLADVDPAVLISVLDIPAEQDSTGMEMEVKGKVVVVNEHLEFRPEKPFEKGRQYQVVSYLNTSFGDLESTVKGRTSYQIKPHQKLLIR